MLTEGKTGAFAVLIGVVMLVGSVPSMPGFLNVVVIARATRWVE